MVIPILVRIHLYIETTPRSTFQYKYHFPGYKDSHHKDKTEDHDRLIFYTLMGIHTLVKQHLYTEMLPGKYMYPIRGIIIADGTHSMIAWVWYWNLKWVSRTDWLIISVVALLSTIQVIVTRHPMAKWFASQRWTSSLTDLIYVSHKDNWCQSNRNIDHLSYEITHCTQP